MSQNPNEPKIVIDNDWKAQAQAEREKLAAQEKKSTAAKGQPAGAQGAAAEGGQGMEGLPQADFRGVLELMVMQAITYMGGMPDPETGRAMVSLEHAKYFIDLLGVLEEKTKGNLAADEAADLTQVLSQLRLQFVEVSKAVAQAIAKGQMRGPAGAGASPPVGPATGAGLGLVS
jgi:hypothetical protein